MQAAERLLSKERPGTYVIRPSSWKDQLSLSIRMSPCEGELPVHHYAMLVALKASLVCYTVRGRDGNLTMGVFEHCNGFAMAVLSSLETVGHEMPLNPNLRVCVACGAAARLS